jgi:predicted nucleotidyltransferase
MDIKELRRSKGLSQKEAAQLLGIPFRTYQNYEYGISKSSSFAGRNIIAFLSSYEAYTPEKGVLPFPLLKQTVQGILASYPKKEVTYAILFGSYAKEKAGERSDVDLLMSGALTGLAFFALQGKLETALHKKVDLLKFEDLNKNPDFLNEILSSGIKIYG